VKKEKPGCSQKIKIVMHFVNKNRYSSLQAVDIKRLRKSRKNLFITILIVSLPSALKITEEYQKLISLVVNNLQQKMAEKFLVVS
jgi:hypothetical protein